jgi:hypothetical protein
MTLSDLKRTVVADAAAVTLVGVSLSVVAAHLSPTASPSPVPAAPAAARQATPGQAEGDKQQRQQQFQAAVAAKLRIAPERLQQAMDQTRTELGISERGPGGGGNGMGGGLDAAAQTLGITVDQLRQELAGARH